ncbi:hydroxymethylglutaryl-CoA reductase, degradative [Labilibacter sediminis]|nr:hydroxymethylglutaryl-CoA reductase, degradative [Labilibacter sediminis]
MIKGFSKLTVPQKVDALMQQFGLHNDFKETLLQHQHTSLQELYNQFSENTLSNFFMPYGIAPGFNINGKEYAIPMVIEESSVVAAASKAAKFWSANGGFKTKVISTLKTGQLFFTTHWTYHELNKMLTEIEDTLRESVADITKSMQLRGGGITKMELSQEAEVDEHTCCLLVSFETADSMGANFINSCLEEMGVALKNLLISKDSDRHIEINMAILSNYTPDCIVECTVECPIDKLKAYSGYYSAEEFAQRFNKAVKLATHNSHRAVTHNKGIMNGVDAVILATGNDFRALEANVHTYACRNGKYSSLSKLTLSKDTFCYTITIPLAIGTVGGLTRLHPMAKLSLQLLGNPNAAELMQITAAAGMANNFSAVAALVTSGIQKGHMKMHLSNILTSFNASDTAKTKAMDYFSDKTVSQSAVKRFLDDLTSSGKS